MFDKEVRQQELNRLHRLLVEKDKASQKARVRRAVLAMVGFAVLYFMILHLVVGWVLFDALVGAPIIAIIHVLVNAPVFNILFTKSRAEDEELAQVRKSIRDLEDR